MRNATDLMVHYAAYHRDQRNLTTHCVGIPLIVFSLGVLLARPSFLVGGFELTPAWVLWGALAAWYLTRGHLGLGLAVSAATAALVALGLQVADGSTAGWLGWGVGALAIGWAFQLVGHYYEGRKPAFTDDLRALATGPMFVTAEALFALGYCRPMLQEIERRAGPTVLRDLAHPVG